MNLITMTRSRPVNRSPYGSDPAFEERTVTVAANAVTAILSTRDPNVSIVRLSDGRQGIRVAATGDSLRDVLCPVNEWTTAATAAYENGRLHVVVPTSQPVNPAPAVPTLVPSAPVDPDASDDID